MTIGELPADIRQALESLPWAENGVLWGIRYSRNRMWNHTHILDVKTAAQQGIVEQGQGGDLILDHDGAGMESVPDVMPGTWQPLVQVHRAKGIVRTSRVKRVVWFGRFPVLEVEAFGPAAGVPVPGDSGSIFFMRDRQGNVLVVGMAIQAAWLSFARPSTTQQGLMLTDAESEESMRWLLSGRSPIEKPGNASGDTEIVTPPKLDELGVVFLQAELVELRKAKQGLEDRVEKLLEQNAELTEAGVKALEQVHQLRTENAGLRDTLAAERTQAAALRVGLEMVGKEMGWIR